MLKWWGRMQTWRTRQEGQTTVEWIVLGITLTGIAAVITAAR